MKMCPTCRHTADDTLNFCPSCGTMMQAVVEEPAQPVQVPAEPVAPTYAEPVAPAYAEPAAPTYTEPAAPPYAAPQQDYVQPPQYTYAQPPYVQPTYVQPPASPVSKGRVIPGMALGIAGTVTAALGLLYTFIYFMIGVAGEMPEMLAATAVMGFIFMAFGLPLSIVGYKMSTNNRAMGDRTTMSRLGITFGRVGLILSIVAGGIAFLAILIGAGMW